jgi:multidrug efflux pump subunit AcrA (membrane-fusion protein)
MMPRLKAGLRWIGIGLLAAFSFLEAGAQAPLAALGASAPGVTQAMRDVKLSVTVAGRIESLQVSEGSRVLEGQLLLHLDRTLEELEVQRRRLLLQEIPAWCLQSPSQASLHHEPSESKRTLSLQRLSAKPRKFDHMT